MALKRDPYEIRHLIPVPAPVPEVRAPDPNCQQGNNPFGHNPECPCRRGT